MKYHIINTPKFKNTLLELRFLTPVSDKRKATILSLIRIILVDRCEKYNSKKKLTAILDELYGAGISVRCSAYGNYESFGISLRAINEKYASKGIFKKQVILFSEIIYHPLFNEDTLQEAKTVLKDSLIRRMEQPRTRAINEAYQLAGEDCALSISTMGDIDELDSIELSDLISVYGDLLENSVPYFTVIGDIYEKKTIRLLDKYFSGLKNQTVPDPIAYKLTNRGLFREISSHTEQSQLVLLYPTEINVTDENFWAFKLGCIMLGQLPVSLLFMEVREKRSLCYSISSGYLGFDGVMTVSTGIDYSRYEEVKKVIFEQIDIIKNQKFDAQLLDIAKIMLINSYKTTDDSMSYIISQNYQNYLLNQTETSESFIQKIQNTSAEEIAESFTYLKDPTILILKGENCHE